MNIIRNPEIKKSLLLQLVLAILAVTMGWLHDIYTALCLLLFSVIYMLIHYLFTVRRYRKLKQLSLELDSMLHNNTPIEFQRYHEGELSILESQRLLPMTNNFSQIRWPIYLTKFVPL